MQGIPRARPSRGRACHAAPSRARRPRTARAASARARACDRVVRACEREHELAAATWSPEDLELVTRAYARAAGAYQDFRNQRMATTRMKPVSRDSTPIPVQRTTGTIPTQRATGPIPTQRG